MRKIILFAFCFSISLNSFSQMDGNYNYSIGLRGFSTMQLPKILIQTNSQDYVNTFVNGIMLKFNDNQINYRINGNYLNKNITFFNQCNTCEIANGSVKDYSFTVGFEKSFNYAKIQPYFGADLGFKSNHFMGEITTANPKNTTTMPYNVDTEKNGGMLSPFLGLRYSPVKQLSFFAETSINFYYSYERQETIQQDAQNTRSFADYNKWEFLLNPISVGIQVHLVSRN